jgi:hypothetical protein
LRIKETGVIHTVGTLINKNPGIHMILQFRDFCIVLINGAPRSAINFRIPGADADVSRNAPYTLSPS